jgi:hypothetical protein
MPINYSDYHPKWPLIRRLILKRANHCCEQCGIENHAEIEPSELQAPMPTLFELPHVHVDAPRRIVILTIAHLDHDRNNNRFNNLKCLCQKCHLLLDQAQRVFSFKYGKETQYQNTKMF